ncbi:trigger factor [Dongshaea marina]|uniref:trigger factor n=1 Tax=Dongshaea marina TaxID=2047966 RepID=UPI000D3E8B27|nr:trigger factor [Dongshaea marina]
MQVSVESTEGLGRRLTITVPAEKIDAEINNRLRNLAKTRRIDGFRQGKAPLSIVRKMYGQAVSADVAGDIMQRNFIEAIISEKLNPAGAPAMDAPEIKQGEDFSFTASFEVYPEVKVEGLEEIEVEKPVAEIQDADLDNMIETLRKQQAGWTEVERECQNEDRVNINFIGSVDGEEFEGGKAENFDLVMGAGRMIPGFEDGIIGKKQGDEFTIDVTFPEEYHAENLKGKAAQFAITINRVEEQELPELTEEFVKRFGIEDGSVDGLKAEIRKNMTRELEQNIRNRIKEQVLDGLVSKNEFDLPSAAVAQEVQTLREQAMQRFGNMPADKAPQLPDELFKDQAERRVRVGLLLGELIRESEMKADEERVKSTIESMASAYEDPSEVVDHYYNNENLLTGVRNLVLEDQVVDMILEKAKVSDKTMSFDEVINNTAASA